MTVREMECRACEVSIRAEYQPTRLGELPLEHQRFIEMFILASGSLKEIASQTGVSYPTVRSRLDRIIEELRSRITGSAGTETILDAMQQDDQASSGAKSDPRATARELIKRI